MTTNGNGRAYGEPNPVDENGRGCLSMLGGIAVLVLMWPVLGFLSHAAYYAFMLGWNLI